MKAKTIMRLQRKLMRLPVHHIDTSVFLKPRRTEDGWQAYLKNQKDEGRKNTIRDIGFRCFRAACRCLQHSRLTKYRTIGHLYDVLFQRLHPFKMSLEQVEGHKMVLDLKDQTCKMMSMFRYDPATTSELQKRLKPGMTFFDIGSHVGYFTLLGARCVGKNGRVYAFEPVIKNFDMLKTNVELNGYKNVSLHRLAISNKNVVRPIFLSSDSAFHSLRLNTGKKCEQVRTVTVDDFCKRNRIKKVDAIKIDVEGGELDALKGMKRTIRRNDKILLIVEFIPNNLRMIGSSPKEFVNTLVSSGFNQFFLLHEKTTEPISPRHLLRVKNGIYNVVAGKAN